MQIHHCLCGQLPKHGISWYSCCAEVWVGAACPAFILGSIRCHPPPWGGKAQQDGRQLPLLLAVPVCDLMPLL